ncbi:MAG: transcription termination/antitermination protein NusG, partial [Sphingobacteriales bacterium]
NRVKRRWSDRTKIIYQPLIPSYVFVCITEAEKAKVRMTDGVVNFVYWLGKPAIIRENEIDLIKRFLGDYENVEVKQVELVEGQRVRVLFGVLTNKEGLVVRIEHNKAYVYIESLGVELTAQFEKKNLEAV